MCFPNWDDSRPSGIFEELEKTFEEEKETDQKLTQLAEEINVEAKGSGEEEQEESDETIPGRKAKSARA